MRRGMTGRAVIVSSGSSSRDLIRHRGAALTFPRGLREGVAGRGRRMSTLDSREEGREI